MPPFASIASAMSSAIIGYFKSLQYNVIMTFSNMITARLYQALWRFEVSAAAWENSMFYLEQKLLYVRYASSHWAKAGRLSAA